MGEIISQGQNAEYGWNCSFDDRAPDSTMQQQQI